MKIVKLIIIFEDEMIFDKEFDEEKLFYKLFFMVIFMFFNYICLVGSDDLVWIYCVENWFIDFRSFEEWKVLYIFKEFDVEFVEKWVKYEECKVKCRKYLEWNDDDVEEKLSLYFKFL